MGFGHSVVVKYQKYSREESRENSPFSFHTVPRVSIRLKHLRRNTYETSPVSCHTVPCHVTQSRDYHYSRLQTAALLMPSNERHDSFKCATRLIYMCDMTLPSSLLSPPHRLCMRDVTHSYVRHALCRYVPWRTPHHYGLATISRLLKILGLFCKRDL